MSQKRPASARYSSTRWHDPSAPQYYSFEDVVLKGMAPDGGLFHPEIVPDVRQIYSSWKDLSFSALAFQVIRPYVSDSEISDADLRDVVDRSYSVFRHSDTVPLVTLDKTKSLHLLELFHGPTFAFKDVALQFLGNLFEFFLVRRNKDVGEAQLRHHLTVIGATSGDTGSAAIYGLRGKKDVSIFIMFPDGKVSPVQEAQMTTVLDANVHNLSMNGTFDDCQDMVKGLFADPEMNKTHHLAAVNSINWARILAQTTYYFYAYFQLLKQNPNLPQEAVQFVVPTGNFGDILAGFYAKRMGLPISKLVIATNENDILHRFWQTGTYSKEKTPAQDAAGGFAKDGAKAHEDGVKETLSPAMDILVSSNFERLLWELTYQHEKSLSSSPQSTPSQRAGEKISSWFTSLKKTGSFTVSDPEILTTARSTFHTHRVSDEETTATICARYTDPSSPGYVLDPHSAVGIAASLRQIEHQSRHQKPKNDSDNNTHQQANGTAPVAIPTHTISLATAHPAKFAKAVQVSLAAEPDFKFEEVQPVELARLEGLERKVLKVEKGTGLEGVREIIVREVKGEKKQEGEKE